MLAVKETIASLMYILSDIIYAWRAVVLWNRDKRVIAILLLFILGTTAAIGCQLGFDFVALFSPYDQNIDHALSVKFAMTVTMVGPILGTNVLSTGLIAWKAWQHRVTVRKHLGEGSGLVMVERVLALLIESGLVYCCLWISHLISVLHVMPDTGSGIVNAILLYASGLYPTLIIALVGMRKSPIEHYSTFSTGMRFANRPAPGPPRAGGVPRHLCTNWHESASNHDTQVPFTFRETFDDEKPENL